MAECFKEQGTSDWGVQVGTVKITWGAIWETKESQTELRI